MKRVISFVLAAVMILTMTGCDNLLPGKNDVSDLMNNITVNPVKDVDVAENAAKMLDFYLELSRKTAGDGNMLVSPLSVLAALSMTANGAKGQTLAQMENVLGLEVETLNSWMHSYLESLPQAKDNSLKLANSIWFTDHETFTPAESFLQTNADYYGAGIYRAPFDGTTLTAINNWVSAHTNGMIQNILDEIPADAVMYLVNALAFEAQWSAAYEEHQVKEAVFTMTDGTEKTVKMMHSEETAYLEDDQATGFIKLYKGGKYAFAALLPNEGISTQAYLKSLTGESLYNMLSNPEGITVFAAMPKFDMEYSVEMSNLLQAMGMKDAFDSDLADFSGLGTSTVGNICISRVLHKTAITVAEQGTKAGAATAVEMRAYGAYQVPEHKTVTLDRPFVYMLIDCQNNLPFFIGTIEDPTQTENEATVRIDLEGETLKEPPALTIRCGNKTTYVRPFSYNWDYTNPDCDRRGVIACGVHPLQFENYDSLQSENGEMILIFGAPAESWSVTCWDAKYHGKTDAPTMEVTLTEEGFLLNEGDCIYCISAHWDTQQYNGTAEYTFRIEY